MTTAKILLKDKVDYVAVGSLERLRYPPEILAKFQLFGDVVFRSGDTLLFAIDRTPRKQPSIEGGEQ